MPSTPTMDQNMKLKSLSIHKKHFLKQLTKLALSLSLFSILLSTWLIPCHLYAIFSFRFTFNPFDHQISAFPLRLIMHGVDKTHVFLLCNGILVFLAKSSGLIRERFGRKEEYSRMNYEGGRSPPELAEEGILVFGSETAWAEYARENSVIDDNDDEDGEEIKEVCECCSNECGEEEVGNDLGIRVEEREGEGEFDEDEDCILEEGSRHGAMTAEEMNRKFDEFIRRIREEITTGSAQVHQQ